MSGPRPSDARAPHAGRRRGRRGAALLVGLIAPALLSGCLGEPRIEDRWTRLDIVGSNLTPNQFLTAGAVVPVNVSADVTYRSILTGFAVAELRVSSSLTSSPLPSDFDIFTPDWVTHATCIQRCANP